jgi:GAF domain-containing protein
METSGSERLAALLARLAEALLTDRALKDDLDRLVRVVCRLLPECSGASVSMLVEGEPTTVAVTDRVAMQLDLAQYDHGEGPCISALGGETVRIGFIPQHERFPHFAIGAADQRVLSVLSTPAIDHGAVVGSLNLYSRTANAFDPHARDTARIFAAEIATALIRSVVLTSATNVRDQLQIEYDTSTLVARAQGALMAMNDCSVAQAVELLDRASAANDEDVVRTAERVLASVHQEEATPDPSQDPPFSGP